MVLTWRVLSIYGLVRSSVSRHKCSDPGPAVLRTTGTILAILIFTRKASKM